MDKDNTELKLPPLTEYLLENIIFAMEDQVDTHYLDLLKGEVINEEQKLYPLLEDGDEEEDAEVDPALRYIDLPDWQPSDGFRTMEKFAYQVRNPIYREKLLQALQAGRGVFRRFKDTIGEQPSLEREWFAFKDDQLKREVIAWYRENDGALQLRDLDLEIEELTDDILQEDFIIGRAEDETPIEEIVRLQADLLQEMQEGSDAQRTALLLLKPRLANPEETQYFYAKTQEGELAGFLAYEVLSPSTAEILFFGNKKEFRGMGLFRFVFDHFCRHAARKHYTCLIVNLAGEALSLDALFAPLGCATVTKQIVLSTNAWNESHPSSESAYL